MEVKCPYCQKKQKQKPIKSWTYRMTEKWTRGGTKLEPSVNCSFYNCICGESFVFYFTRKGKFWTIPKPKKQLHI